MQGYSGETGGPGLSQPSSHLPPSQCSKLWELSVDNASFKGSIEKILYNQVCHTLGRQVGNVGFLLLPKAALLQGQNGGREKGGCYP